MCQHFHNRPAFFMRLHPLTTEHLVYSKAECDGTAVTDGLLRVLQQFFGESAAGFPNCRRIRLCVGYIRGNKKWCGKDISCPA